MKRIDIIALVLSVICSVVFAYIVKTIDPVFRDLNIRLPSIVIWMLCYPYVFISFMLVIPQVSGNLFKGSGVPASVSIFTIFVIVLVSLMFVGGCLHSMEFDMVAFAQFGYGVFPALIAVSVLSWVYFAVKKCA